MRCRPWLRAPIRRSSPPPTGWSAASGLCSSANPAGANVIRTWLHAAKLGRRPAARLSSILSFRRPWASRSSHAVSRRGAFFLPGPGRPELPTEDVDVSSAVGAATDSTAVTCGDVLLCRQARSVPMSRDSSPAPRHAVDGEPVHVPADGLGAGCAHRWRLRGELARESGSACACRASQGRRDVTVMPGPGDRDPVRLRSGGRRLPSSNSQASRPGRSDGPVHCCLSSCGR